MTTDTSLENKSLVAHLLRRAGFGGTVTELDHFSSMDYEPVSYTHLTLPTNREV